MISPYLSMKRILFLIAITLSAVTASSAQIPTATQISILKAEDSRDYIALRPLLASKNLEVQKRAVLAAGRIGSSAAVEALASILQNGDESIRPMAAFALGETEADSAAPYLLGPMGDVKAATEIRARAVEAAGKIAAANREGTQSKALGPAIVAVLKHEHGKRSGPYTELIRAAITAVLRSRPEGGAEAVAPFLSYSDQALIADALNTLSRLRYKGANQEALELLAQSSAAEVRANAARLLGAAEDKESIDLLIKAAIGDVDSRVRVSAFRSLAALKDSKSAEPLLKRGEELLAAYSRTKKPNFIPVEQSEFIEVATALGRILANTDNPRADKLFADFGKLDKGHTPEVYIARVRVGPKRGDGSSPELVSWRQYRTMAQVIGEFADIEPLSEVGKQMKAEAPGIIRPLAKAFAEADPATEGERMMAGPDALQAFARFKTEDLGEIATLALQNQDVHMRAAAASVIAELSPAKENVAALVAALQRSLETDKKENDAQLAILAALLKTDKNASLEPLRAALGAQDYLLRKAAIEALSKNDNWTEIAPERIAELRKEASMGRDVVWPYDVKSGTKLGQVLNTDADYRRAITRKNGTVKAVFTTEKGTFAIDLLPEDAPLTVDNFVKLANSKYFNGLEVHRVVPNFVMQDGDPRGDGNGGPGWSIRCEMNMVPFDRGAVGMALSGKDTGGSQWFVTHAAQPHLDGGYTVFGRVNEADMKVVDKIVRGDKIISVRIIGR